MVSVLVIGFWIIAEEQTRKRCRRNSDKIRRKINNMNLAFENIPDPRSFTTDEQFNKTVD
jgi:hypothetical protein